jgi:hypothetical protein
MLEAAPRAAVVILCRVSAGSAGRRLGNVLEIGVASLILEIDQPPAPPSGVSISMVVPGSGTRVTLEGVVAKQGPLGCLVEITSKLDPGLAEFVRRRVSFADKMGTG